MTHPKITVIVAVFNAKETLPTCINGYSSQTYQEKELIVIDGGSTDGSVELLEAAGTVVDFWTSEPDNGIYDAWNKGLSHATGDWIVFIGADDRFWSHETLAEMASFLEKEKPQERVVYGQCSIILQTGEVIRRDGGPWDTAKAEFKRSMTIPHPGTLHHRSLFAEHGGFDSSFQICGDYELLMRELKTGDARFMPGVTTVAMLHGGTSYAPSKMASMLNELKRLRQKHGLPEPGWIGAPRVLTKMRLCAFATRLIGDKGFRVMADTIRVIRGKPRVWRS